MRWIRMRGAIRKGCVPDAVPDAGAEDPRNTRSALFVGAFSRYLRWYFRRNFHAVRISRAGMPRLPAGRPAIVYTNHPSWWDPALFVLLSTRLLPGRPGFGPMEADALAQYGLLRRIGVFGVESASRRGAARFLNVSISVLANPSAILWVTAEGAFTDARSRPVRLRPGIAHLARRIEGAVLVPLGIEYTFWNERRPEALVRFGDPLEASRSRDVGAWTGLLEQQLSRTMDALAADSMTRDASLFLDLERGAEGVGCVYDLWRRFRAVAAGQAFDPSHDAMVRRPKGP
jgi:1-acyl-sn-glycerol-3-phosphate acyltransferase